MHYLTKKTLILFLTLLLVSLFTFFAFHIIPGDPARLILGTQATEEKLQVLRHQLGTDRPLSEQYLSWMGGFLKGDFGNSIRYSMPVKDLIGERLPVTLLLGLISLALILLISIPIGIFAARVKDTFLEQVISFFTMAGISTPGFFISILFIWIFGLILKVFTPGQYVSFQTDLSGFLQFMFFPALAIAVPQIATLVKYIRASMLDELGRDYVRTAKGKGASLTSILYSHVFRNAVVSVIPLFGMIVGSIFSGSIIVEQVFGVPGIGRLLISSVTGRDFPLTQALVMYIATIIVITNFVVDILIQVIDPRIRLS